MKNNQSSRLENPWFEIFEVQRSWRLQGSNLSVVTSQGASASERLLALPLQLVRQNRIYHEHRYGTMSDFEIMGVVLGTVPLLISGLEHYKDGRFHVWRSHRPTLICNRPGTYQGHGGVRICGERAYSRPQCRKMSAKEYL